MYKLVVSYSITWSRIGLSTDTEIGDLEWPWTANGSYFVLFHRIRQLWANYVNV